MLSIILSFLGKLSRKSIDPSMSEISAKEVHNQWTTKSMKIATQPRFRVI